MAGRRAGRQPHFQLERGDVRCDLGKSHLIGKRVPTPSITASPLSTGGSLFSFATRFCQRLSPTPSISSPVPTTHGNAIRVRSPLHAHALSPPRAPTWRSCSHRYGRASPGAPAKDRPRDGRSEGLRERSWPIEPQHRQEPGPLIASSLRFMHQRRCLAKYVR